MTNKVSNNKRVAKNTIILYIRQILILLVSLYTVRVLLNTLGVENYGIYNVVAGIVTFFTFFSGAMAAATQRFFSFALGQNDFRKLNLFFSANCIIYVSIAILAFILLETVGLWYIDEHLSIPQERFESARLLFHFSVLTFLATIFSTPFIAIIIAHEDMRIYAYVSIIDAMLKLLAVILLVFLPWDKLELYGILLLIVSVIIAVIYIIVCIRKYEECQFRQFYWDKNVLSEVVGFTGWTLFGQVTGVMRNQAIIILLNQMFNPVVVAAKAISSNVANFSNVFSNNFNVGLYPPIIKLYAADDKKEMFSLVFRGSKITFFLMWVLTLPLFLEMESVLQLWLKSPPTGAVLFTRLALVEVLINSASLPLMTLARAPGRMKSYELTLGSIQIAIFIVSLLVISIGAEAYSVFIVAIVANIVMLFLRLMIIKKLISEFPISSFYRLVIYPVCMVVLFSVVPAYIVHWILPKGFIFTCMSVFVSVNIACINMYFIGLERFERKKVQSLVLTKMKKLFGV